MTKVLGILVDYSTLCLQQRKQSEFRGILPKSCGDQCIEERIEMHPVLHGANVQSNRKIHKFPHKGIRERRNTIFLVSSPPTKVLMGR